MTPPELFDSLEEVMAVKWRSSRVKDMLDWFNLLIPPEPLPNFLFVGSDFTLPIFESFGGKVGFQGFDFFRKPSKTFIAIVPR